MVANRLANRTLKLTKTYRKDYGPKKQINEYIVEEYEGNESLMVWTYEDLSEDTGRWELVNTRFLRGDKESEELARRLVEATFRGYFGNTPRIEGA